ncbi:hypothetical protein HMPREF0027_0798 [Actinobacillus ureae ATCC 25976]|uniref:BstEII n=1 Tax=Actinobacillus ureae ATCC 25976 TaxID=887324 RepID=E8KG31_9PAST|nr:hypothetical protein [Actinobacillus ureae]EFX92155.1 hypothetical protein HMPREF0027_0798 [Actinobacillus ureae ATCC 25976]
MKNFRDYTADERRNYITLSSGEYYPDILVDACNLYTPVLETFSRLLKTSESSKALLLNISNTQNQWMRIQLCRVFRKYVSPETPVEMLKKKNQASKICNDFGDGFRPIPLVQKKFDSRPLPDEALCAVLWEYKDRGKKGYDLTDKFFDLIQIKFPDLLIWGPRGAGSDVQAIDLWNDYPNNSRPLDFVISSQDKKIIYAVGLARYDGDRGGAQEDDRTGGYKNCSDEILEYIKSNNLKTKIIFLNDGPGLLLGSMWEDYSKIEERHPNNVKVITLRMLDDRLSESWLKGED